MKTITIAQLPENKDFMLVTDSQETKHVRENIGKKAEGYDSFFILAEEGDYTEVWGFCGTIPYLSKLTTRIV